MKAVVLILVALAAVAIVPSHASAQQASAITVQLVAPPAALKDGDVLKLNGTVTYTADVSAMTAVLGIPVTYAVTKAPDWATVVVSPANDVFPAPTVPAGLSYTVTRAIEVTISVVRTMDQDQTGLVEITATTGTSPNGRSATGHGDAPITYKAPAKSDPCPFHTNMTQAQMDAYAAQAVQAYDQYEASKPQQQPDQGVTAQTTNASPIPVPWLALLGFAAAGAGAGLLLRRKLSK